MADPNPCLVPLASLGLDPDVLARVQAIADQRTDSTALLLAAHARGIRPDLIVFADTERFSC